MHSIASFDYAEISGDDNQRRSKPSGRFWTSNASCGWSFEFFCMAASFLCTGAISVILFQMNHRSAQSWTFHFTINSVIAALSTLLKITVTAVLASCLSQMKWLHFKTSARQLRDLDLYDAASRGSTWGAAVVLWYSLCKWSSFTAAAAAFTTILVLPTSIAVQQLVGTDLRSVTVEGQNASFPVCLDYNGGTISDAAHGSDFYPQASTADVKMQGAIYNGIFNISTTPIYTCPSTCVWDTDIYHTLGFHANCTDVTKSMVVSPYPSSAWITAYSVMTPNNISMSANFSTTANQAVINVKAIDLTGEVSSTMPAEFIRIGILKSPVTNETNNVIDQHFLEGYECTVAFSGYSYSNASANGTHFSIGTSTMTPLDEGLITSASKTESFVQFNKTHLPKMTARVPDIGGIVQFFTSDRFSGTVYNGEGVPNDPQGVGVALLNADVGTAFSAMADSMTAQLRQSTNSSLAYGKVLSQVAFVHVYWYYLLLPLAVQCLSLGLLIQTWLYNKKSRVALWKDSTVAVLYHGVVSNTGSPDIIRTDIESTENLNTLAKQSKARLD